MPFFTKSVNSEKLQLNVRASLAFMFAVAVIIGFFTSLIPYDGFMALASMAISWYFATRNVQDGNGDKPNV